jgi:hypothetical protein
VVFLLLGTILIATAIILFSMATLMRDKSWFILVCLYFEL